MTIDRELLEQMLAEDEFGLLASASKRVAKTGDQRLEESFVEILDFVRDHDREPDPDSDDIAEMQLGLRLRGLRDNVQARTALADLDSGSGLLAEPAPPASVDEALADDPLGLLAPPADDLHELRHVPKAKAPPDKVAQREPCADFEQFKPLFERCQQELRSGARSLAPFRDKQGVAIAVGNFYVLRGVLTYVAEERDRRQEAEGRIQARLRCIFENGTEADLLLRSLSRQLYDGGKRVTDPNELTLAVTDGQLGGGPMGCVYVLRSLSEDPQLSQFGDLHKIGFTNQPTKDRLAGAETDATFLGAKVEEVQAFDMPAAISQSVESMLHRIFTGARIDAWFERDGIAVADVREWFDVPLSAIEDAVELIGSGGIPNYEYDPETRAMVLAASGE